MKKQTAAEKAKVAAHQKKVDKENAEERKKDPYAFELEKLYEQDMEELDNIMDEQ